MPNSVHAARWTSQLAQEPWDVRLFPAWNAPPHTAFRGISLYGLSFRKPPGAHPSVRLRGFWPTEKGGARIVYYGQRALRNRLSRAHALAGLIQWLKPDVVHSLEIQQAGYLTLAAKNKLRRRFPPWIVSNWGSDIFHYGRQAEHRPRIREVMAAADYVHAECERDIRLSHEFGFRGEVFGVFPGGGGFDLEQMQRLRQPGQSSGRRLIVLNGRQGEFGRALTGLRALELCADLLRDYRVVVPLATPDVEREARRLARDTGLEIEAETEWVSRERMLALQGSARISIRLGVGDAASHTLLEAISSGSFPIVSCTTCADEWIQDGRDGLIVPPEDPQAVAEAVRRALTDDHLVDRAAEQNARVAAERLDERVVRPRVVQRYREVLAEG